MGWQAEEPMASTDAGDITLHTSTYEPRIMKSASVVEVCFYSYHTESCHKYSPGGVGLGFGVKGVCYLPLPCSPGQNKWDSFCPYRHRSRYNRNGVWKCVSRVSSSHGHHERIGSSNGQADLRFDEVLHWVGALLEKFFQVCTNASWESDRKYS